MILPLMSRLFLYNMDYSSYFDIIKGKNSLLTHQNISKTNSYRYIIIGEKDTKMFFDGGSGINIYEYDSKIKMKKYEIIN